MPNQPSERDRGARQPHARPTGSAAGRPPAGRGAAGALRSRAGVGIAAIAAIAALLAVTGVFAMPQRSPDSVAVAGATSLATAAPSEVAEVTSAPSADAPASAVAAPPSGAPASPAPSASAAIGTLEGVPVARLQETLDRFRKKTGIPGISVAILWNDGRAWAGASGKADVARKEPMTTGTAFAFASVSKTFTAAVVLQLVAEGKVGLDQPAADLLPAYRLDRRITVRMLLDHRSSLPDFFSNAKIDRALQRDKQATWTPERTWKYVPKFRPTPGTVYDYSNTNYLLLGELVEHVTGNPLAVEVRRRLLDPLHLDTAWYQVAERPKVRGAVGYRLSRTGSSVVATPVAGRSSVMPFRSVVSAAGGAGSIAGTATDAAIWMQAYASGRIVGEKMHREMIADVKRTQKMRAIVPYGLGIQQITIEGQRTLGHSGRYLGFQNSVRYLVRPGITIAILTNQNTVDPAALMHLLVKVVAPVKPAG